MKGARSAARSAPEPHRCEAAAAKLAPVSARQRARGIAAGAAKLSASASGRSAPPQRAAGGLRRFGGRRGGRRDARRRAAGRQGRYALNNSPRGFGPAREPSSGRPARPMAAGGPGRFAPIVPAQSNRELSTMRVLAPILAFSLAFLPTAAVPALPTGARAPDFTHQRRARRPAVPAAPARAASPRPGRALFLSARLHRGLHARGACFLRGGGAISAAPARG